MTAADYLTTIQPILDFLGFLVVAVLIVVLYRESGKRQE